MADEYKPRFDFGDVMGQGFRTWFRNLVPFTLFAVIIFVPLGILWFAVRGTTMPAQPSPGEALRVWAWLFGKNMLVVFLYAVLQATIIRAVVEQLGGRKATIGSCFSASARHLLPILGISFLMGIPVGFGLACFILPGLMLWALWWISVPVCVMEGQGVIASMTTSWQTVRAADAFWTLVGIVGILLVIQFAVAIPLMIQQGVFEFGRPQPLVGWAEVVSNVVNGTLQSVMVGVAYHRLRVVHVAAFD